MNLDIAVIMGIWNEEDSISDVLSAVDKQTLRPSRVFVVDDGSVDNTANILKENQTKYRFRLVVITLPRHKEGRVLPNLPLALNQALKKLRQEPALPKYIMKLDGDHCLPSHYVENIVTRMEQDDRLAVASGWIVGEGYDEDAPRGSGMIVRTSFWNEANGIKFYVSYAFEDWLHLKALQMGYKARSFRQVASKIDRKSDLSKYAVLYGRGMYELGYDELYALGACMVRSHYCPEIFVKMLSGYLGPGEVSRLDISNWVRAWQRRAIPRKLSQILKNPMRN